MKPTPHQRQRKFWKTAPKRDLEKENPSIIILWGVLSQVMSICEMRHSTYQIHSTSFLTSIRFIIIHIHPSKSKKTKKMHLQGSLLHTNPFEILSSFKTIFTVPSTLRRYKLAALATISLLATSRAKVPAQYRPIGSTLPSLKRSPRGFHRGRPVEPWRGVVNATVWQPNIQGIWMDLDGFFPEDGSGNLFLIKTI